MVVTDPRARAQRRQRTRFEVWAWSPVIILRIALIATYLVYIYAGVIAVIAGIPVFDLTQPPGYATIWGALLAVSAVVCGVGALDDRWQPWERWASLVMASLMVAYTGALNGLAFFSLDLSRMFVGAISFIALILPACRFVYLASQTGKKKAGTT
jgi:hypothetical protein